MKSMIKRMKTAILATAAARRVQNDIRRQPSVAIIALVAGAAASFFFNIGVAAIWALFILFLVYEWDVRIVIIAGAVSFLLCMVFVLFGKFAWAEVAVVYTYFFLAVAGVMWFVEFAELRDRPRRTSSGR